jgi:hypothetical protein
LEYFADFFVDTANGRSPGPRADRYGDTSGEKAAERRKISGIRKMTAARWTSGLDLGQATDPAALVCCKQAEGPDPLDARGKCWHYAVRHIHEFHLGTPYTTVGSEIGVAEQVQALYLRPMPGGNPLAGSLLGVDYTGVGRPVFDILRGLAIPCVIVPITSTGGALVHQNGWEFSVPKRALVSNLLKLYQCGRVRVAERLPHRDKLERQLAAFRVKQRASGHEAFEADKISDHDDTLFALALAVWVGETIPVLRRQDVGTGRGREQADAPPGTFLKSGKVPDKW